MHLYTAPVEHVLATKNFLFYFFLFFRFFHAKSLANKMRGKRSGHEAEAEKKSKEKNPQI
jgi:hypothetical protein